MVSYMYIYSLQLEDIDLVLTIAPINPGIWNRNALANWSISTDASLSRHDTGNLEFWWVLDEGKKRARCAIYIDVAGAHLLKRFVEPPLDHRHTLRFVIIRI